MKKPVLLLAVAFLYFASPTPTWDFDEQLDQYFINKTEEIERITSQQLANISDWEAYHRHSRRQLQDMLGLLPWPKKSSLRAKITGTVEHNDFIVQKIHFQSMPGLYVTGNLYLPKKIEQPLPAIIYVCGHATVKKDGYNFGAKVHYQHHPAWFARHGYICLIIDTLQLGEIEGIHHGLHRYDRLWWLSRGFTPAGVEAWNGIRAIDYLISRPEVDRQHIGVTGRSGGGVTSWWIAALDDRITAAVPVAGITDMRNHIIDGCIEGHCDCMFMFNHHRWDFAKVVSLVAPRPTLLSNTDRDPIFPLDGVYRIYREVRPIYESHNAADHFALHVTAGGHQDVQELRIHAFRWFDRHLKNRDELIRKPAERFFTPEELRVFESLPNDEINTKIDRLFIGSAPSLEVALNDQDVPRVKMKWRQDLDTVFSFWPANDSVFPLTLLNSSTHKNLNLYTYRLSSDDYTTLPVFHFENPHGKFSSKIKIIVIDDRNWSDWGGIMAVVDPGNQLWETLSPLTPERSKAWQLISQHKHLYLIVRRGTGPARFTGDKFKQTQIRKRFYLLGETLDGMQTWDLRQAINAIVADIPERNPILSVEAQGTTAGQLLYASLYHDSSLELVLDGLPTSHMPNGPHYPRILKYLDIPAALLLASEKHEISIKGENNHKWDEIQDIFMQFTDTKLKVLD